MTLRQVDILGVYVEPAVLCLAAALLINYVVRRGLDRVGIDRWVWNRALFDFSVLVAITAALVLCLRVPGS